MKSSFLSIFIVALLGVIIEAQIPAGVYWANDVLGKFVHDRMQNGFKKWFISKIVSDNVGFQPPLRVDGSNCRFSLTGKLSEVRTTGDLLPNFTTFTAGNILAGRLYLRVSYMPEGIQGKYNLNGTILNGVAISGDGFFRVTAPPTIYTMLNFTDFCISPQGHIDLSCANLQNRTATIGLRDTHLEMDEMSVGGFEGIVSQYLLANLVKHHWNINPLTSYVAAFLQEEFNSTTAQDIAKNSALLDDAMTTVIPV